MCFNTLLWLPGKKLYPISDLIQRVSVRLTWNLMDVAVCVSNKNVAGNVLLPKTSC